MTVITERVLSSVCAMMQLFTLQLRNIRETINLFQTLKLKCNAMTMTMDVVNIVS